jgi:hypothetical protein
MRKTKQTVVYKEVVIGVTSDGIVVAPDPVDVPRKSHDVSIYWTICTPGWEFTDEGIVIHENRSQFIEPRREGKDRNGFHWKSRNTHKKLYKYTINVTNGTTTASRDPGIKNGGH